MTVCQKLGVILESKVVQKLSLEKKVFNEWLPTHRIFLKIFPWWHVDSWPKSLLFKDPPSLKFHDWTDINGTIWLGESHLKT